jgi:3-oxoacyl-[acyl-carrier protein] reductase
VDRPHHAGEFPGCFCHHPGIQTPLLKGKNPVVVNISSVAGRTGVGSNVAYCASKAAMDSMTRSLGRALAPAIRVVSLSPGWVQGDYAGNFPAEYIGEQIRRTPLNRLARAADVAAAVLAIAESFTFSTAVFSRWTADANYHDANNACVQDSRQMDPFPFSRQTPGLSC